MEKILILGGSGFIGGHLAEHFQQQQPVVGVEVASLPDLDLSSENCHESLLDRYNKNTVLVLLAATKRQYGDTLESFRRNLDIVQNVGSVVSRKKPQALIFFSSAAVYGEETHNTSLHEQSPIQPQSYYGLAKYTGECLLMKMLGDWAHTHLLCLRPPLVYGPGDFGKTYGPAGFCAAALAGDKIRLWGDGSELREFLYVGDLCRMIVSLLEAGSSGVVNAALGVSHSFLHVIQKIEEILGAKLQLEIAPRTKNKVDNRFNPAFLVSILGRQLVPTPLEDGLRAILEKKTEKKCQA